MLESVAILDDYVTLGLTLGSLFSSFPRCDNHSSSCYVQDIELSDTTPPTHLPTCCHAPSHDDNGVNQWNCKWATPYLFTAIETITKTSTFFFLLLGCGCNMTNHLLLLLQFLPYYYALYLFELWGRTNPSFVRYFITASR